MTKPTMTRRERRYPLKDLITAEYGDAADLAQLDAVQRELFEESDEADPPPPDQHMVVCPHCDGLLTLASPL